MSQEPKRLDALVVDVEDSTTLLKLYIGRLMKAPARSTFYPALVEHASEISEAVVSLGESQPGRDHLGRIASVLRAVAAEFDDEHPATLERILALQEGVDLLEAQLDHMVRFEEGGAPEVLASLERLEASVGAVRPLAAPATRGGSAPETYEEDPFDEFALTDEFLDELVDGFDAALDASVAPHGPAPAATAPESPSAPVVASFDPSVVEPGPVRLSAAEEGALRELFAQIASGYVGPITDFVGKLRVGPVTAAWVDLCLPAVASMARASASMGYGSVKQALTDFGSLLEQVRSGARVVDGDDRARVLAAYQRLAELLPPAFPIVAADPGAESESIILNSLLKQIKGVGRITIARLFAAGLVSLEAYDVADPGDLAAAAGLRLGLATAICERFREYREASQLAADAEQAAERLEALVAELRTTQFDFKKATLEEWYTHEPSRAKAKARRARQQCMWKINVAIAELGEVDFLNSIKDEIYDKRLARLDEFVRERRAPTSGEVASEVSPKWGGTL
jgi:hypothetical protein